MARGPCVQNLFDWERNVLYITTRVGVPGKSFAYIIGTYQKLTTAYNILIEHLNTLHSSSIIIFNKASSNSSTKDYSKKVNVNPPPRACCQCRESVGRPRHQPRSHLINPHAPIPLRPLVSHNLSACANSPRAVNQLSRPESLALASSSVHKGVDTRAVSIRVCNNYHRTLADDTPQNKK